MKRILYCNVSKDLIELPSDQQELSTQDPRRHLYFLYQNPSETQCQRAFIIDLPRSDVIVEGKEIHGEKKAKLKQSPATLLQQWASDIAPKDHPELINSIVNEISAAINANTGLSALEFFLNNFHLKVGEQTIHLLVSSKRPRIEVNNTYHISISYQMPFYLGMDEQHLVFIDNNNQLQMRRHKEEVDMLSKKELFLTQEKKTLSLQCPIATLDCTLTLIYTSHGLLDHAQQSFNIISHSNNLLAVSPNSIYYQKPLPKDEPIKINVEFSQWCMIDNDLTTDDWCFIDNDDDLLNSFIKI